MTQLTCKNLTLGYDGNVILENLNFSVKQGEYLCIVGENGSGKSTLIKTILSLLKPLNGEITFDNDISSSEIGYLPQQTLVQRDFPASVNEIVISGCLNKCGFRPFYNKAEKLLALHNMERLGINHLKNKCYRELSGGQQQRVLLARALCATGKMLLLDEPVTGLDPKAMFEMYEIINKLNQDGITIIMISHDVSMAIRYADHILHIGDQLFFGTTDEYLKSDLGKVFSITHKKDTK